LNYYEHHLGDYLRHTAHLSMLEDGAYRRLIDAYYIREAPLPNELREVFRLVRAQSKQDREAVETVLREFFTESPDGWRHGRCEHEIERFRLKSEKARASIRSRWERARNSEAAEERTDNERNTNVSSVGYERSTDDIHRAPVPTPQTPDTTLVPKVQRGASQASPRASRLPPDWTPGPDGMAFAATLGLVNGRADAELAKFRDFWSAKAGKDATKLDWQATWRNWLRRSVEGGAQPQRKPAASDDIFAGAR